MVPPQWPAGLIVIVCPRVKQVPDKSRNPPVVFRTSLDEALADGIIFMSQCSMTNSVMCLACLVFTASLVR